MRHKLLVSLLLTCIVTFSFLLQNKSSVQAAGTVITTPTFNSIGIIWQVSGNADRQALVEYRLSGSGVWQKGLPMEYDAASGEYRGSIVQLQPNSDYEIKMTVEGTSTTATATKKTWNENVPILKTVIVSNSNQPLVINESGTSNGYILYAPAPGQTATINVSGTESNIKVNGSFVIIRGLTLTGNRKNGIKLGARVHDVVIENNDISGWGTKAVDGWGYREGAIESDSGTNGTSPGELKRIVIQCNLIHDPLTDSNNWEESRSSELGQRESTHPLGPEAVILKQSGGNHVIRYNTVRSTDSHYFDDIIAGTINSASGFPYADTDIYGNYLERSWDDAIEADGDNINVRIWNNYFDKVYNAISTAPNNYGPLYVWRNVLNDSARSLSNQTGAFMKGGSVDERFNSRNAGIKYVFNNTVLDTQIVFNNRPKINYYVRNNVFMTDILLNDPDKHSSNDLNYDLYSGKVGDAVAGTESNGIQGTATFTSTGITSGWFLKSGTKGYDAGIVLPNFTDNMVGKAPDMGAYESGVAALKFGTGACGTSQTNPIITPNPNTTVRPAPTTTPNLTPKPTVITSPTPTDHDDHDVDPDVTPITGGFAPSIFPTPGEGYIHPGIDIKPAPNTSNSQYIYSTHAGFVTYAGPAPASLKEKGWMVQIETDLNRDNSPDVITRYNHIYPETIMINDFKYKRADYSPNYFIRMTENGMEKLPYGYGPYVARNQLLAIMGDSGSPGEKHVQYDIVTDRYQDLYDATLDTFSCLDDPYFEVCTTDPSRPGFFFPVNRNKGEVVRGPLYNNPGQATPPPAITPIIFDDNPDVTITPNPPVKPISSPTPTPTGFVPSPTPTIGPISTNCNPSNGSGGLAPGQYLTTVAGLNVSLAIGASYNPSKPTYLGFHLHGDGGNYEVFSKASNQVVQEFADKRGWILVAVQAPNGSIWWKNFVGDHNQKLAAVFDEMFQKYNICKNTVFGTTGSGGAEFWSHTFFPAMGGKYPAHTVLACGGNDPYGNARDKVITLGKDLDTVNRSTFSYVYGTNDNLYKEGLIPDSISFYKSAGFRVETLEMAGAGHCNVWKEEGFPTWDERTVELWSKMAIRLGI